MDTTDLTGEALELSQRATKAQALAWRASEYSRTHPDEGWARTWADQTAAESRRLTDLAHQAARDFHGETR